MALSAGARLGPYEILEPLGAGGMGEVYRARDTRLRRTVAIKVLPSELSSSPSLRQRLEREAEVVSSLSHSHICTLHDIGRAGETDFLVMEYLEGEILADRLAKGRLPLDQALRHASEIADALDTAHEHGVIHRDLKPGNVMLTKSGAKLLDFGLAKLRETESEMDAESLSEKPTQAAPLTEEGKIIGTYPYMAPEQLEGKTVDVRTDIFAFGAMLYEMVTGRRAFEGKSRASLIAAILERDPAPLSELQPTTPAALDRVVKKCLAKNPEDRWQTAHDLHDELRWIAETGSQPVLPGQVTAVLPFWRRLLNVGLPALIGALVTGTAFWCLMSPDPQAVTRFAVTYPATDQIGGLALSPDGRNVVFAARRAGVWRLYRRSLGQLDAAPLPGTERGHSPFFSPDGQWIGFFAGGELKKVPVSGGTSIWLCESQTAIGATWGADDTIVFGGDSSALMRVPAAGGTPEEMAPLSPADRAHGWPHFLPGGRALLFESRSTESPAANVEVLDLDSGERKVVYTGGTAPSYLSTGHVAFISGRTLFVAPFDLDRLDISGRSVAVLGNLSSIDATWGAPYAVSASGTLLYAPGGSRAASLVPAWVDRQGNVRPLAIPAGAYYKPALSPDGTRLALAAEGDVWVYDLIRGSFSRLTLSEHGDWWPVWSPDGRYITFGSGRSGKDWLFRKRSDGGGEAEELAEDVPGFPWPGSWSPDGRTLAFTLRGGQDDLWTLSLDDRGRPGSPKPFLQSRFNDRDADFSPDGRWLAYMSDESGRFEIYVRPFPGGEGKWQVSTEGGLHPIWARDTRELFYRSGDRMMVADYTAAGDAFLVEPPRELFTVPTMETIDHTTYDVTADGKRFVVLVPRESDETPRRELHVVLNWFEEVRRLTSSD